MERQVEQMASNTRNIGRILLESGKLKAEDAERIIRAQKEFNLRFGDAAVKLGLVTEEDVLRAVSQQFDYTSLSLDSDTVAPEVIAAFRVHTDKLEDLRSLRSQLALRWFAEHTALVVASGTAEQGASNVVANLAVMFSQLGEKCLIIDADLRKPRQHELFKVPNNKGLSDILAERAGKEVIQAITGLNNLYLLTSGTLAPNPLELLTRGKFWNDIQDDFDVILIDTAPALESTDAQLIAAKVNGVLIVTKSNHTRISDIEKVKQQILVSGAEIVGAVINDF